MGEHHCYIPAFSVWANPDAYVLFDWKETDFPMERMRESGWEQWRHDAERYILMEFSRLPIAIADDDDEGVEDI